MTMEMRLPRYMVPPVERRYGAGIRGFGGGAALSPSGGAPRSDRRAAGAVYDSRTSLSADGLATPLACAGPFKTFWLCASIAVFMQACPFPWPASTDGAGLAPVSLR